MEKEKIDQRLFDVDDTAEKESDKLFFSEEETIENVSKLNATTDNAWNVLVVDDEEDIHSVTRMALKGFVHLNREINFLHAYSAKEAKQRLNENPDIALILLDVVMETSHAGLDLVKYIRNDLKNKMTQIVLRTGYPGQAPEREVIVSYEINDYKTKTELTTFKLFTVTLASLRAYNAMSQLDDLRKNLEIKVQERTFELEKKNIQIMEMDQMKTRFFSNISHEFRTPLTLIIGPLEDMLMHDEALNENKREKVEMMHRNSLRILGLINQLLDLSKIDAGSLKLELVEYDIIKVLTMIARSFSPLAERKKIKYSLDIPEKEIVAFFDYDKIEKIVTNLLSNAFKFTPEEGKIACSVRYFNKNKQASVPSLQIVIEDSGPGIPGGQLEKIFERFFQVENSWQRSSGGTGIGLSLTKELVHLQHGEIKVESHPDKGSRFIVLLPIGKEHLQQKEYIIKNRKELNEYPSISRIGLMNNSKKLNQEDEEKSEESDKTTILIVDDNDDVRAHVRDCFNNDYKIYEAENGSQGIELARKHIPDIIVSDWMMPEMEGTKLCEKLKNDELTSHIPIILLTAKASTESKVEGLGVGADDYVTKPFNSSELYSRTKNLIEQRKKLLEKFGKHTDINPEEIAVTSADEKFLIKAKEIIEKNMTDCDFDVNSFFPEMGMSRMQLFRKIKAVTNQSPSELIRNYRLKRAEQLMKQKFGNIAEITYEVGFNNLSYFAKCFKDKYSVSPSEYIKRF